MLVVAAWPALLAIGASVYAPGPSSQEAQADWRRGAVVPTCMALFLGGWVLLLTTKRSSSGLGKSAAVSRKRRKGVQEREQNTG